MRLRPLYDGELKEAASHINSCPNCRNVLREYAEMKLNTFAGQFRLGG